MHAKGGLRQLRGKVLRRARRLLIIVVLTYAGVCVFVALAQSYLIYFPSRNYSATPADVGLGYDEVTLKTSDGVSLVAWYVSHPEPKGTILFCHGNAGNLSHRLYSLNLLHRLGYNVLIFDYRGYGHSEGRPGESGTYLDAEAAWRHLSRVRGESPDRVVVFGRSLGGAVAIDLASRHTPAALVVESTFTNLVDIGSSHYPWLPVRLLLRHRYDSIDKIPAISCPKLFVHGVDDTLIPISNGRQLFEAACSPKQFIETPGGHNTAGFTYSPEYTARLSTFLDDALGKAAP